MGFVTSAPGKVIIFGEHSVVYRKPAVAASASSLRTYLLVEEEDEVLSQLNGFVVLDCPDIAFKYKWSLEALAAIPALHTGTVLSETQLTAIQSLLQNIDNPLHRSAAVCFLYLYTNIVPVALRKSVSFILMSTLPVGAGLGSSASISVSLANAMLLLKNSNVIPDKDTINHWAYVGEMCIHGDPSGIDNTIATFGGAIEFTKDSLTPPKRLVPKKPIKMVLTYTKIPRSTKTLVSNVRELYNNDPTIIKPILDGMGMIAQKGTVALENDELSTVLELVRINHGLLVALGVSHPGLEKIKMASDTLKIGQTKLTGAGGGGCALTILNDSTTREKVQHFMSQMESQHGYKTFETTLGGSGCCHLQLSQLTQEQEKIVTQLFHQNKTSTEQIDNILLPTGQGNLPWTY